MQVPVFKWKSEGPDLGARIGAINDVAKTVRALLTSMAAVAVGMAATMVAATDEAIFRDAAKVFPSLSVEIRLSTAFTLAPPIFAFLHLNALLQLHLLTRRLRAFVAVLDAEKSSPEDRESWFRQMHGLSFVQMLLPQAQGRVSTGLQGMATWISVVGVPVLLLLAVQVSFVRYQSWAITLIHMACLGADMALLLWFQFSLWPGYRKRLAALALPGVILVVGMMTQAVPPNRRHDERNVFDVGISKIPGFAWTRRTLSLPGLVAVNWDAKPDLLKSLAMDEAALREMQKKLLPLSLPRRSFVGINLEGAELFAIDLSEANLRDAQMNKVQMRGANLFDAQMQRASLPRAQIQGASLLGAEMQAANLGNAQMQGVNLSLAEMQGTNLGNAQMQGVDLSLARMQGARLFEIDMSGASGVILECKGMRSRFVKTTPLSRGALLALLTKAGVPQPAIDRSLRAFEVGDTPHCGDAPDQSLSLRSPPPSTETGREWRIVACKDSLVAEELWVSRKYLGSAHAILARPPEAGCTGLRDVSSRVRRHMDKVWAGLSPADKAAAERAVGP